MELRPGYTMTELGVLPEDWEVKQSWMKKNFGDLFEFIPTNSYSRSQFAEKGTIRNIHYGDILTKFSYHIDFSKEKVPFLNKIVSEKKYQEKCFLKNGDLIIANTAEDFTVGKGVEIVNLDGKALAGQHTFLCRPKIQFGEKFLGYLINSEKFHGQLTAYVTGIKVSAISKKSLSGLFLEFPQSVHEQYAIAAALSDVDALLDAQERLIAKKRNIKLAAMQQLLTGKTRLPGFQEPWIKKFFGEIFEFLPTNPYSRSQFVQRGCIRNIHYGDILTKFSFIIDISKDKLPFINNILSEKNYPQKCFLQNGDVVIANTAEDLTVGKAVEVINIDGKILSGQHTFLCRPKIRFAKGILGYLINSEKFHGQLAAYVTGIKVSSISKTSLSGLFLEFPPSLDEQRAIAAVLSDMDAELAALEARRDKLRAVKQGMMRELLTGRTRLAGAGGRHGQ